MKRPGADARMLGLALALVLACGDGGASDGGASDDADDGDSGANDAGENGETGASAPTSGGETAADSTNESDAGDGDAATTDPTADSSDGGTDDTGGTGCRPGALDAWQRHLVDGEPPTSQIVFVAAGRVDDDALPDIVAGPSWYRNPGAAAGPWTAAPIGGALQDMAVLHDFDGDGALDVLGTGGAALHVALGDGNGGFAVTQVATGGGDFLQGIAVGELAGPGTTAVALSWHADGVGVESLTVPARLAGPWPIAELHSSSLDEALSTADIDGDGDIDLFQGTQWLDNDGGGGWTVRTALEGVWTPDRHRLADIDGDGDLDAVVGFEGSDNELVWLEHGPDPIQPWPSHSIAAGVGGGFSLDAADMDCDGDVDVVLGEHRGAGDQNRVIIYENDGAGAFAEHVIDGPEAGIDHHDGTVVVDIDGDADADIVSIGWYNVDVWLYENLAL